MKPISLRWRQDECLRAVYRYIQMNTLAIAIMVVLAAAAVVVWLMWVSWHP
jgi:predicted negative regulator of RcsB-dependent stress response